MVRATTRMLRGHARAEGAGAPLLPAEGPPRGGLVLCQQPSQPLTQRQVLTHRLPPEEGLLRAQRPLRLRKMGGELNSSVGRDLIKGLSTAWSTGPRR
eukprot:5420985-Pyramimonas_sp.AAC.1